MKFNVVQCEEPGIVSESTAAVNTLINENESSIAQVSESRDGLLFLLSYLSYGYTGGYKGMVKYHINYDDGTSRAFSLFSVGNDKLHIIMDEKPIKTPYIDQVRNISKRERSLR